MRVKVQLGLFASAALAVLLLAVLVVGSTRAPARASHPTSAPTTSVGPASEDDPTPEVRGNILDGDGNAVMGATVRLVSPGPPYSLYGETKSGRGGAFSFAHVAEAALRVVADHDADGLVSSAVVRVSAGQTTELTLVLSATHGVRGVVLDPEQHAIAGASLQAEGPPWPVASATTDDAGTFHMVVVPDETSAIVTSAAGFATGRTPLAQREDGADLVIRVQLALAPPAQGDVVGVEGEGARATVTACAGQPNEVRTTSADDGTFELPARTIGCKVVAEQPAGAFATSTVVGDRRRTVLRLVAGGSIEGTVVDERGSGVPTFSVGIEAFTSTTGSRTGGAGPRSFNDPGGAFRLDKLAPGSYVLTASTEGRPPARSEPVEVAAGAPTRGVSIVLSRGGSVAGRVFDEHHTPLEGVVVHFDAVSRVAESSSSATTDESGRYHLDGAPAGPLSLRATKSGFRTRLVSGLTVAAGATLTADITLASVDGGSGLELGGIGATLSQGDKGIELAAVGAGDPADRAGLQKGDRLRTIDGESTDGMSVADAVQRLRGASGTSVGVSVARGKNGETFDVVIVRGTIVR